MLRDPQISVGIMNGKEIRFSLFSNYRFGNLLVDQGDYLVSIQEGKIEFRDELYNELILKSDDIRTSSFELKDAVIGIDFHWERKENQRFQGDLKFIVEQERITAINLVSLEDYLRSVISSEMSATSSKELLKAHAVISRSWLLAQVDKTKSSNTSEHKAVSTKENELVRWWDREDHDNFDVCADDHCQRYQGITKETTPLVADVIRDTFGQVLVYHDALCDTRFSKCCGGYMELFENVWEPVPHPYLVGKPDTAEERQAKVDLTKEEESIEWIKTSPHAFCNTTDKRILSQVLNDYDQETTDFYRWTVSYTQEELSQLILDRSGIDYGKILQLIPIERGTSGRIVRLKIIGTQRVMTIGKELEIRRTLSKSHLYSSAFAVEPHEEDSEGVPTGFTLYGAGWGHGVGLCQIGAAVMADQGFTYKEILAHYYPGADIESRY